MAVCRPLPIASPSVVSCAASSHITTNYCNSVECRATARVAVTSPVAVANRRVFLDASTLLDAVAVPRVCVCS
jgi:hypothetical protein